MKTSIVIASTSFRNVSV